MDNYQLQFVIAFIDKNILSYEIDVTQAIAIFKNQAINNRDISEIRNTCFLEKSKPRMLIFVHITTSFSKQVRNNLLDFHIFLKKQTEVFKNISVDPII